MAYWTHTVNPIGEFVEKDYGNTFEFSLNNDTQDFCKDYSHKVWVGGIVNEQGYRYANVKKTVAYIAVDEADDGTAIIEKWNIKKLREYNA